MKPSDTIELTVAQLERDYVTRLSYDELAKSVVIVRDGDSLYAMKNGERVKLPERTARAIRASLVLLQSASDKQ